MKRKAQLPCELIIWYVLPDLRNEISRVLLDEYNYKQVEIAKVLGVTKAAVNQYLSSKRGENFFNLVKDKRTKNMLLKEVRISVSNVVKEQTTADVELCRLCGIIKGNKIINKVYEKYGEGELPKCLLKSEQGMSPSNSMRKGTKPQKCLKCKKELQNDWISCPFCGEKVARKCPDCKGILELTCKVCPQCNRKLTRAKSKARKK